MLLYNTGIIASIANKHNPDNYRNNKKGIHSAKMHYFYQFQVTTVYLF